MADEGINLALADAVERYAAKDSGVGGMLERATVVCHPESEPQKKIALDTKQDSTPHPSRTEDHQRQVHEPAPTTSTDQDAITSDVTRKENRTRPTRDSRMQQGSHRWRCRDRQCGRKQCGTPEPVGIRQQKEDHNEEGTT